MNTFCSNIPTASSRATFFLLVSGLLFSSHLAALDYEATIGAGIAYNDNLPRNPSPNREDDTTYNVELDAFASHESRRIKFDSNYHLEENYYEKNTLADRPRRDGSTYIAVAPWGNFFQWVTSHSVSQELQDARQVETTENIELRNLYQTGPVFSATVFKTETITLRGSYTRIDFDKANESDTKRVNGQLSWRHAIAPSRNVSLSVTSSNAEPDDEDRTIKRNNYAVEFKTGAATGGFEASLGFNTIDSGIAGQKEREGVSADINYFRDRGETSLRISGKHQLLDSGITFATQSDDEITVNNNTFGSISTVERTFLEAQYANKASFICRTCSHRLAVKYSQADFDDSSANSDESRVSYTARVGIKLGPRTRFNSRFSYRQLDFDESPKRQDEVYRVQLSLSHKLSKAFSTRYEIGGGSRSSTQDLSDYEDYLAKATFSWKFLQD